jgi:hypothetical protein
VDTASPSATVAFVPDRRYTILAAVGCVAAVVAAVLSPDPAGHVLFWDEVTEVRADTRFRRGLRTVTLEIDAGAVLAVFTKRTLGVEPSEAAARIAAVRSP